MTWKTVLVTLLQYTMYKLDEPVYKYVQGDCVIEFERNNKLTIVCVPLEEATELSSKLKENSFWGNKKAWSRVEQLYQKQNNI